MKKIALIITFIYFTLGHLYAYPFEGSGTVVDPFRIKTEADLLGLSEYMDNAGKDLYFKLSNNITLTADWQPLGYFTPNVSYSGFEGTLDGGGFTIDGLKIVEKLNSYTGLFACIGESGTIKNLGITNADVTGVSEVGILVGINKGLISHCYTTGTLLATTAAGGLAGDNSDNQWPSPNGRIENCYSRVSITAQQAAGGFVGLNNGEVSFCYSTGKVEGNEMTGGFIGTNNGLISKCYYDTETSQQLSGIGFNQGAQVEVTGQTTAEMKQIATFDGWDFITIWTIIEGVSYPKFIYQPKENAELLWVTNVWEVPFSGLLYTATASISIGEGAVSYSYTRKGTSEIVEGNSGMKDAGEYTVTATLPESTSYNATSISHDFTITKIDAELAWLTSVWEVPFSGSLYTASANISIGEGAVSYSYTRKGTSEIVEGNSGMKDAGVYTVTATLPESTSYNATSISHDFTITKIDAELAWLTSVWEVPFSGSLYTASASISIGEGAVSYSYTRKGTSEIVEGNSGMRDAGVYTVTATLPESTSYNATSISHDFTITKIDAELAWLTSVWEVPFSGSLYTATASISIGEGAVSYSYTRKGTSEIVEGNSGMRDAGEYTVTATLPESTSYNATSISHDFTIIKVAAELSWTADSKWLVAYDTNPHSVSATIDKGIGTITITYQPEGSNDTPTTTPPSLAGTYVVVAFLAESVNYTEATITGRLEIIAASSEPLLGLTINGELFDLSEGKPYEVACSYNGSSLEVAVDITAGSSSSYPGNLFYIDITKPGMHTYDIELTSPTGKLYVYRLTVAKKVSGSQLATLIEQRYNQLLAVNNNPSTNGGYTFVTYNWYKNGVSLGYHQQVYYNAKVGKQPFTLNDQYHVVLTTNNGTSIETCPYTIEEVQATHLGAMQVYPNPITQSSTFTTDYSFEVTENQHATLQIYDMQGRLESTTMVSSGSTLVQAPRAAGTYIVVLQSAFGKVIASQKILVTH